jgi:tetrahydromethanopterin S-methyltransferase subunit F
MYLHYCARCVFDTQASNNTDIVCLQKFGERLGPIQRTIEDVNDQTALFTSNNVLVSHINLNRLEDLNTRYDKDVKFEL